MKKLLTSLIATTLLVLASTASATVVKGNALQGVLNDITVVGDSSVNVHTDQMRNDELWSLTASGGSFATLVIELAGYENINSFGVYDYSNPLNSIELFAGDHVAGYKSTLSINAAGVVSVVTLDDENAFVGYKAGLFERDRFGYYLNSGSGEIYYSQAILNESADGDVKGDDHMVAYQGQGDEIELPGADKGTWTADEYILAWEDMPLATSDKDYTDFVVMVESVEAIPEPALLAIFGLGLAAFGFVSRKRK